MVITSDNLHYFNESYSNAASLNLDTNRGPAPPVPLHTKPVKTTVEQVEDGSVQVQDDSDSDDQYWSAEEESPDMVIWPCYTKNFN